MSKVKNWMLRWLATTQVRTQTRELINDRARAPAGQETASTLLRVVAALTPDRFLQEDLLQEAVIHLWQLCNQRPGQSPSWYFKSCQLYLLNLLRKGRSIDSFKHHQSRVRLVDPAADDSTESGLNELADHSGSEESVFAQVCARDILSSLYQWLDAPDRLILDHLADGLSAREIAFRLQLSHTTVLKRQRKIASVAVSLGFVPSAKAQFAAAKIALRRLPSEPATGAAS